MINFQAINATRERQQRIAEAQFISEVARAATQIQAQQPDLSRTEALRVAERLVAQAGRLVERVL